MTVKRMTLTQFQRQVVALVPELEKAMVKGFRLGAQRLKGVVVEKIRETNAVASGQLAASVGVSLVPDGALVTVDAPHAGFVEEGTRPHRPPLQPLIDWVKTKGLARDDRQARSIAFAVQRAIALRGTRPRFYFRDAWEQARPEIEAMVAAELEKV
jgi:transcriptional regulator GlxA family with amidase domain